MTDNIGISDVLTVVTTRAEDYFKAQIAANKEALAAAEKEAEAASKYVSTLLERETSYPLSPAEIAKIAKLEKALGDLGVAFKKTDRKASKIARHSNTGDISIFYPLDLVSDDEEKEAGSICLPLDLSQTTRSASAAHKAASKRVADLQKIIVGWKTKISEIPAMERRYRANIVEMKMGSSADGQALLSRLTAKLDADLAAGVPLLGPKK